jgi:phosphate starvation-inducible protein PhoH
LSTRRLHEAQNISAEQMQMFLTRLGFNSRMVVTGDVTQVDLPSGTWVLSLNHRREYDSKTCFVHMSHGD